MISVVSGASLPKVTVTGSLVVTTIAVFVTWRTVNFTAWPLIVSLYEKVIPSIEIPYLTESALASSSAMTKYES